MLMGQGKIAKLPMYGEGGGNHWNLLNDYYMLATVLSIFLYTKIN